MTLVTLVTAGIDFSNQCIHHLQLVVHCKQDCFRPMPNVCLRLVVQAPPSHVHVVVIVVVVVVIIVVVIVVVVIVVVHYVDRSY